MFSFICFLINTCSHRCIFIFCFPIYIFSYIYVLISIFYYSYISSYIMSFIFPSIYFLICFHIYICPHLSVFQFIYLLVSMFSHIFSHLYIFLLSCIILIYRPTFPFFSHLNISNQVFRFLLQNNKIKQFTRLN